MAQSNHTCFDSSELSESTIHTQQSGLRNVRAETPLMPSELFEHASPAKDICIAPRQHRSEMLVEALQLLFIKVAEVDSI